MREEFTEAQKRVSDMLDRNNVCVRVSRRWGKTKLAELLAKKYEKEGKSVMYVCPEHAYERNAKEDYSFPDTCSFGLGVLPSFLYDFKNYDLVICDEAQMYQFGFWIKIYAASDKTRLLILGTTTFGAPSAADFALCPHQEGWKFYTGGINESSNGDFLERFVQEEKTRISDIEFKTQYLGY